ncbi:LysM domain-containing protein [Enterococcus hirae]|nr:LysM domain-containing protein [Enterococcaceae bacterium]MCI1919454.1 LysM domain-containing protein [Enterococcaceae bacterium]MDM8213631.1 LysM domain-containing protein [Enterococcus hirae]
MKSIKSIILGTTLALGVGIFGGAANAFADSSYTIKSGDTLSTISQQFAGDNSLVSSIASANGISDVNMIFAGETITVPDGATTTAPVQQEQTYVEPAAQAAPVQQEQTYVEPAQTTAAATTQTASTSYTGTSSSAKEWIAGKESGGSYSATNGRYIGRYQLDSSYLNGDYSAANQERVADNYVSSRYGSWEAAQSFWQANGWY